MPADGKPRLTCAIYTRKSTEEGLEQEFNSLDAQREACEAYVLSQRHEGWRALDTHYDDGGFTGGNTDRPGLKQLLEDVRNRKVSVVVVYKVDRLTRALSDFAKIVETFDAHGVSFVSVTQQFNTTSSMGRLTLNVLLSFAQFEREVTGERIRDKIAASRKKGMWMGGPIPLGYDLRDHKLIINSAEADTVRTIFNLYAKHGCVQQLKVELDRRKLVSKHTTSQTGRTWGGRPFGRGQLYYILKNRIYIGEAVHKGQGYPGQHAAIITSDLWDNVQASLKANRYARSNGTKHAEPSLLAGILFDDRANRLSPSHTQRHGRRYRYYVCQAILQHQPEKVGMLKRLPAQEIEHVVENQILDILRKPSRLTDALHSSNPDLTHAVIMNAKDLAGKWLKRTRSEQMAFLRAVLSRVTAGPEKIEIVVNLAAMMQELVGSSHEQRQLARGRDIARSTQAKTLRVSVPVRLKRSGRETRIVMQTETSGERPMKPNRAIIKMLARAFDWFEQFQAGRSTQQIANDLDIDRSYVAHVMSLVFLAPDVVEAILDGRQQELASFSRLPSLNWTLQRVALNLL
jgi:site-specific DNA recombinase